MKKTSSFQEAPKTASKRINIKDVEISNVSTKLYDYKNRKSEITALAESISVIGQQQPITVLKDNSKYLILDGVLRLKAILRLKLNEIDAIICDFPLTDEFSLQDLIIHHQIRKQKTNIEKLNEVRTILRIDSEKMNPLRDKEKRVKMISSLLGGKGWGRNNVYSLENILRWEKKTKSNRRLAERVISNEIKINRALETIRLIENPLFDKKKEEESHIIEGYLNGKYPELDQVVLALARSLEMLIKNYAQAKDEAKMEKHYAEALRRAKEANLSQEDMPTIILIISDMEFDSCGKLTNYENKGRKPKSLCRTKTFFCNSLHSLRLEL